MIGRIWRASVHAARTGEYEHFAAEVSLPMFRAQGGFLGAAMLRHDEECIVLTFWRSAADVAALDTSSTYRETVERISAAGFLHGDQSAASYEAHLLDLERIGLLLPIGSDHGAATVSSGGTVGADDEA